MLQNGRDLTQNAAATIDPYDRSSDTIFRYNLRDGRQPEVRRRCKLLRGVKGQSSLKFSLKYCFAQAEIAHFWSFRGFATLSVLL